MKSVEYKLIFIDRKEIPCDSDDEDAEVIPTFSEQNAVATFSEAPSTMSGMIVWCHLLLFFV